MSEQAPRVIVEFGSGPSSVRLAKAFPDAQVLSLESSDQFAERSRAGALEHGIGPERLRVELRPLRFRRIGAAIYETYQSGPFPPVIDVVLIDGPPHWTKRGREACLYDVAASVRVGGRIYLDDYGRKQDKRIADNWRRCYGPAFRVYEIATEHGVCVLEKTAAVPLAPPIPFAVALDSWVVHAKRRLELATKRARGRADRVRA